MLAENIPLPRSLSKIAQISKIPLDNLRMARCHVAFCTSQLRRIQTLEIFRLVYSHLASTGFRGFCKLGSQS